MSTLDRTIDRRAVLATAGVGLVGSLSGCTGNITDSIGGKSQLQQQLDALREETKKYKDPKKAIEDGFKVMGPYVPGMGWHFINTQRVKAAAKNGPKRSKPQLLTYNKEMKLGSVEWGVPTKAVSETPDLFADESADATEKWHPHKSASHVFANGDDKQTSPKKVSFKAWITNENWAEFRPPDEQLSAGDTTKLVWGSLKAKSGDGTKKERVVDVAQVHPDLTTLHAWIHTENPEGTFAPVNPEWGGKGHH